MAAAKGEVKLNWEPVVPLGPELAFHTGCIIKNCLYLHGGITTQGSTHPSGKFHRLNLSQQIWEVVHTSGSPTLSHHACIALNDRYVLLIGGWNGKSRTGTLYAYDTAANVWLCPEQSGFPRDAGLSSHTANRLGDGSILILGREGSRRTQRRTGNAYLLQGSVEKGFTFSEYSRSTTSRSGHTTHIVGSKLYVIGGRDDNLLEFQNGFSDGSIGPASSLKTLKTLSKELRPMSKLPCGRRHHVSMCGPDIIFVHGGETFDGRSREPVGEMFCVKLKPEITFYKLGDCQVKRAGHICFTDGEYVYIHGGITGKTSVCGDLLKLVT